MSNPFIAKTEDFVSPSGVVRVTTRSTVQRDSDGTQTSIGRHVENGVDGHSFERIDRLDGLEAMVVNELKSKMSTSENSKDLSARKAYLRNPPAHCANPGEEVAGNEELEGQPAIRLLKSVDADTREVLWRLPAFSCAELQLFVQKKASPHNSWTTVMGKRPVSFNPSPSSRASSAWESYKEVKPSDMKRALVVADGVTKA